MSVPEKPLTQTFPISSENGKGGEKRMASEWDGLMQLSKEELVIELVKERISHREIDLRLREIVEVYHPSDVKIPLYCDDRDEPRPIPDDWAYRIARYAYEHADDKDDFSPYDLNGYGIDDEQAEDVYRRLRVEGIITNDAHDLEGWF